MLAYFTSCSIELGLLHERYTNIESTKVVVLESKGFYFKRLSSVNMKYLLFFSTITLLHRQLVRLRSFYNRFSIIHRWTEEHFRTALKSSAIGTHFFFGSLLYRPSVALSCDAISSMIYVW